MSPALRFFARLSLLLCASPAFAADYTIEVGGQTDGGGYYGGTTPVLMFSPTALTVNVGDSVTFINYGGQHNVTSDTPGLFRCAKGCDGAGGDGTPSTDAWTSKVTFNNPGTFGFHCEIHNAMGMRGTITVNGTAATPTFAIGPGITGSWYNPAQSGQGFNVEVMQNNNFIAFWYAFDGAGHNLWLTGLATANADSVTMNLTQTKGGFFPPNFDPTKIARTPWGTLTLQFADCNNGTATWAPADTANFAAGSMPIKRLTAVSGLACP